MIRHASMFRADSFIKSGVGSDVQRSSLIQELKQKQIEFPNGMDFSNVGCWRFGNPCKDIDWLLSEITELLNTAINLYNTEDEVFARHSNTEEVIINYWANINKPNSRNAFHTHKEEDFSAVYYLQGEETGNLRFPNPANMLGDCNKFAPFTRDFNFSPRDGDLILWPAWMPHEVEPNRSSRERINLTFNIRLHK